MEKDGQTMLSIPYSNAWTVNGHAVFYIPTTSPASLNPKSDGWNEIKDFTFAKSVASGSAFGSGTYVVTEGPVNMALAILAPMAALIVLGGGWFTYHKHQKGELKGCTDFFQSKA